MQNHIKVIFSSILVLIATSCDKSPVSSTKKDSTYTVFMDIASHSTTYANGRVYDKNNHFITGATLKVDDVTLAKLSYEGYYANIGSTWQDGSTHTFSVKTPDGGNSSGTVTSPTGRLTGVIYNPSKGTIADSYTVSPPSGVWPENSHIYCSILKNGSYYGYDKKPTGTASIVFSYETFINATSITFYSSLLLSQNIKGYSAGSIITVDGIQTEW